MSDREQLETSRAYGLRKRQETRLEHASEKLVKAAYDEMLLRILAELDARVRERERWIREASEETEEFWLKMRARGLPTRVEERDAYRRLHAEIREIGSKAEEALRRLEP